MKLTAKTIFLLHSNFPPLDVVAAVPARGLLGAVLVGLLPLPVVGGAHLSGPAAARVPLVALPLRLPEGGAVLPAVGAADGRAASGAAGADGPGAEAEAADCRQVHPHGEVCHQEGREVQNPGLGSQFYNKQYMYRQTRRLAPCID